jgi:hypothetical protein
MAQEPKVESPKKPIKETSTSTTTTTTTTTTSKITTTKSTTFSDSKEEESESEAGRELGDVYKIPQNPYDASRGTPSETNLIMKRTYVRDMMKFAWAGYREKAWGFNEVKPDSGRPSTTNIFGAAKTGASIIDALDTLWIMELKNEFADGEKWVRESFDIKVSNSMLSCFETVIRFLGGLLGAYHMSGNEMFMEKAVEETRI